MPISFSINQQNILIPCPLTSSGLTCHRELPLRADSGGIVAGDAGVVAVVLERHLGYLERAHELLRVDGDARGGHDLLAVLAPRDAYGHVSGRHHAGDVHQFADGSRGKVKWLDQRGNCGKGRYMGLKECERCSDNISETVEIVVIKEIQL